MNENPGEMPNPLNPNKSPLDANPSEPVGQVQVETVQVEETAPVDPLAAAVDPMTRPMEQAPAAEPVQPKKSKKGLIIGLIIAAVVLICGGVAAAIVLINMNKPDPVVKAIEKIVTGNEPSNIAVDGTITLTPDMDESPVSEVEIALDSQASTSSMLNSSVAKVTATFSSGEELSFEFDEVYAANGDLYFRIDGMTGAIEDYVTLLNSNTVVDCEGEDGCDAETSTETGALTETKTLTETETLTESGELIETETTTIGAEQMLESMAELIDVIEVVDGEWLRVSVDDLGSLTEGMQTESTTSCLVDLTQNISNYNNSVAEAYGKNAFISSTTDGVTLASKGGEPVRKVVINSEKFGGFVNAIQNSTLVENLYNCMGYSAEEVNADNIVAEIDNMPAIYVEVDKDYNFTRLYLQTDLEESEMTVTADLNFSYPDNINVAEPTEYKDFSDVIQQIFTSVYVLPGAEEGTVVVE